MYVKPSAHQRRHVSVLSERGIATVGRFFDGKPVRNLSAMAITRAALQLGIALPPAHGGPVVGASEGGNQ